MDFSWIKQLAEETNQLEISRQEEERRQLEEQRLIALATVPFTEKLYTLLRTCCEEFNKFCMFPDSRINVSKLEKKSKLGSYTNDLHEQAHEVAYFTFARKSWLYGLRGINGVVDFVQIPTTEGAQGLSLKLDEMGVDSRYKLEARIDPANSKTIVWYLQQETMDGNKLVSLCQRYFCDFIQTTNE